MNHLRELIEHMPKEGKSCLPYAERAVCFEIGDAEGLDGLRVIHELVRPPFPTCWFELTFESSTGALVLIGSLVSWGDNLVSQWIFAKERTPGASWKALSVCACSPDLERQIGDAVVLNGAQPVFVAMVCEAIQRFLSALHCLNVRQQEHTPDAKLQKARAKRGKAPLFSYWTLQLDGKSERGEDQGGTHASPRVHLRRGHPRQYAPGKWTWVQAHAVGNRAAGVVHKDYSAGPALAAAAR